MNKYTYIVGFLTAGLALTACSSYDEDDFNESRQRITAQMALSVSGKTATRMTVAATQSDEQFQGMKDITLIPFSIATTGEETIKSNDYSIASSATLDAFTSFEYDSNSNLFDITVPIGTNAFLVYGRSSAETTGALTPAGLDSQQPSGISFTPVQFVSEVTNIGTEEAPVSGAAGANGNEIVNYLNGIFNANWANPVNTVLYGLYPMVQKMKAGSSASVIAFVQEIYDALKNSTATGVSDVLTAIANTDYVTVTDGIITFKEDYEKYPSEIGLPDGTAVIEWVEGESNYKFKAVTSQNNLGAMNVDVTKFVKPAELWYRANSRINTDIVSKIEAYESETTWDGVLGAYAQPKGMVMSNTRSVAVRQQMQYAVGRLDVKLATATSDVTYLLDKANNEIAIDDLAITGVLVGQQCPVDFQFQSKGGDAYTIYDSDIASSINASDPTHTLVLETQEEETVNVAVELQNNSTYDIVLDTKVGEEDVEGQIVPPGCKFYLVGQLNYANAEDVTGKPTHKKVFLQDEVTEVTFTVNDLKLGYYVIPPLSSSGLVFSLGVKDWKFSTPSSAILK